MPERPLRLRFADRVRVLRERAELAQEDLAARAKLSRHYVSEIESGHRNPSLEVIGKLARGLGVKVGQLMDL